MLSLLQCSGRTALPPASVDREAAFVVVVIISPSFYARLLPLPNRTTTHILCLSNASWATHNSYYHSAICGSTPTMTQFQPHCGPRPLRSSSLMPKMSFASNFPCQSSPLLQIASHSIPVLIHQLLSLVHYVLLHRHFQIILP